MEASTSFAVLLDELGEPPEDGGKRGAARDELEQLRLSRRERLRALALADVARGRRGRR